MFRLDANTRICADAAILTTPVQNAVAMLERDLRKVFGERTAEPGGSIALRMTDGLPEESYRMTVSAERIVIEAGDDLGFIYGLLHISEAYLGILPFWFWMDQAIPRRTQADVPEQVYVPEPPKVRYRGWFFNDEVLMMKWKYNDNSDAGWRMCFEALLRCGGNMTIPGTDKMSRKNRQLAADYGLWITHHHAEPLGAEMFKRAYPDTEPNYLEHPELFRRLWEDAVIAQKDCRVVWNLCFRGQGDAPFWSYDTTGAFDTPEKRGRMISEVIRTQADIVRRYVENPVFCTNLYGEIMELYEQGYVTFGEELESRLIKVRADNGYGRMVTRRREDHNPRVNAMPDPADQGAQGIYYHVSFYDLQAANHITMLPNSVSFVNHELDEVLANGGGAFWVINCSNVRPHVYYLDAVRKKWFGRELDDETQSREFVREYYIRVKSLTSRNACIPVEDRLYDPSRHEEEAGEGSREFRMADRIVGARSAEQSDIMTSLSLIADCYRAYPDAMLAFGSHEDEHAGEQFYTENVRILANRMLVAPNESAAALKWLTGGRPLAEQAELICGICRDGLERLERFYRRCAEADAATNSKLFHNTLFLQSKIHYFCAKGVVRFGEAYAAYRAGDYESAFVLFGRSAECFDYVNQEMRAAEYGVWDDFYRNDAFADVKHTAYMVRKARSMVREVAEGSRHDLWYHKYCYAKEDQGIYLLLVTDNHMTDEELYQVMKNSQD